MDLTFKTNNQTVLSNSRYSVTEQTFIFYDMRSLIGFYHISKVGRYKSPDEHPFFPDGLPEPLLPPLQYPQVSK